MVVPIRHPDERGMLSMDLFVAMGLLVIALIPISFSFLNEQKLCRAYYEQALVMQILDGEMEVLAAGEWKAFREGRQDYPIEAMAMKNLRGKMLFTRTGKDLRLEWQSADGKGHGKLIREAVGK